MTPATRSPFPAAEAFGHHPGVWTLGWPPPGQRAAQRVAASPALAATCKLLEVGEPEDAELEDERALCEQACSGDREALARLLRRHGPRLYRTVLLPRLGSSAAAEDALSNTYLKVIERIRQFAWQSVGFYPWLRRVGLNVAIDQLRKRRRETLFGPEELQRELDRSEQQELGAAALEEYDLAQSRQRVEALLATIHPRYAVAVRLRILEAQPREAVARELGVSLATFDVVLHRAMAAIKKALHESRQEEP